MSKTDLGVHWFGPEACFVGSQLPDGTVPGLFTDLGLRMGSSVAFLGGFLWDFGCESCDPELRSTRFAIWAYSMGVKREREEFSRFLGKTERYFYGQNV